MEKEQLIFAQTLEQLKETARLQENMLTSEQIQEAFEEMKLGEAQLALIYEYLQKHNIGIDEPGKVDENLTDEDVNYLNIYLDELKELVPVTDGEKRAVIMSAMAQDMAACNKLVEIYLPQVVEIAKLYAGQGALVEDLIGEGNVALATAVTMLECVESVDEVEGFLGKMIMDAMQDYIGEDADNRGIDEQILDKVNNIYTKAKEMAEELLRKVTVSELAKEMEIEEDEILEAIRLSANNMDYIEDGTKDGQ